MTKKIFAMFLALLMVVSVLPTSVFAASDCKGTQHSLKNCTDYTAVYVKNANCGEKGFTTYQCNKCGDTFVDSWTDPVGEHKMVPATEADNKPAYCGVKGAEGGMICSECGHREGQKDIPAIGKEGVTKCEFPAWEVATKDCTEAFTLTRTCLNCTNTEKYEYKLEEGKEYDHAYGEWELVTPATADAPGKAVRKCTHGVAGLWTCGATEEQEVFFAHKHDEHTLLSVDAVPYTCTATGVAAHQECRICGKLFKDGEEVTLEDLKVASYHDQLKANKEKLNCKNTSMVCDKADCDEVIRIDINQAHTYGNWTPVNKATCLLDGYRTRECSLCDHIETNNIPALGHIVGEVTVDSTCSQYEYTFTYCLRDGCTLSRVPSFTKKNGETPVSFAVNVGEDVLSEPTPNLGFYLQFKQANLGKTLYFDGKTSKEAQTGGKKDYYLNSTDDIANAVEVKLEVASDDGVNQTYRMFFMKDGVKTYISIFKSGNYVNVGISSDMPTTTWAWNADHGILTTTVENVEYCLSMYDEYATFGASKISYLETSFGSEMLVVNGAEGVKLLNITPNFAAGMNPEGHDPIIYSKTDSTCLVSGTKIEICSLCKTIFPAQTVEKADHEWVDDGDDKTVNVPVDCLTDGKEYQKCEVCGIANIKVTPATGHDLKEVDGEIFVDEYKGDHKNIITYKFNVCEAENCPLRDQFDHNKNSLAITNDEDDEDEVIGARVIIEDSISAWVGAGKIYANEEAAKADHPNCTLDPVTDWDKNATCTVAGYEAFDCSGCDNTVLIKSWKSVDAEGVITIHTNFEAQQIEADCDNEGGYYTYICACGKKVGKDEVGTFNKTADKTQHDWQMNEDYEKVDCDAPNYDMLVKTCKICDLKVFAMTDKTPAQDFDNLMCETTYFEYYFCYECDTEHMRSFLSELGHEWVEVGTPTAPTCTTEGHQDKICKWCKVGAETVDASLEVIAKLPHKNAAGDEFYATCKDTVTDRHCVECCKVCNHEKNEDGSAYNCLDKDGKADTKNDHCANCYYPALNHVYGDWIYVENTCEELPYKYHICTVCFDTPAAEYVEEIKVAVDEKGNDVMEEIVLGHRPVAVDRDANDKEIYYGQYTYAQYPLNATDFPIYRWIKGGIDMDLVPAYEAKYIEFTAPNYTTEGYAKYVCAVCGETIEEVLPATEGLSFEMEVKNANGREEITYGSLVEIIVYANSNGTAIHNFNFEVNYDNTKLVFVEADRLQDSDFNTKTTSATNAEAKKYLGISGTAVNTADGLKQNITVGEKTVLTKLYFRYIGKTEGKTNVTLDNGEAFELNSKTVINCAYKPVEVAARTFMDFNNDGDVWFADVYMADAMLNGEYKYDVTIDVDKDGEITLADLFLIYDYCLNNVEMEELLFVGIDNEAEIAVLRTALKLDGHKYDCDNYYCTYTSNEEFTICPACKTPRT